MQQYGGNGYQQGNNNRDYQNTWIKKQFSASALLFWVKGSISVDVRFVRVVQPNTLLGLIPAGTKRQNIPLQNITDAQISTSYKIGRFILGALMVIVGLMMLTSAMPGFLMMGLLLVLLGAGIFLNAIMTQLVIEKAGSPLVLSVPFFNKEDIVAVDDVINDALGNSQDKTDLNLHPIQTSQNNFYMGAYPQNPMSNQQGFQNSNTPMNNQNSYQNPQMTQNNSQNYPQSQNNGQYRNSQQNYAQPWRNGNSVYQPNPNGTTTQSNTPNDQPNQNFDPRNPNAQNYHPNQNQGRMNANNQGQPMANNQPTNYPRSNQNGWRANGSDNSGNQQK